VATGLTPARAGSTRYGPPKGSLWWTHPRSRGEHDPIDQGRLCGADSPPLARGAQVRLRVHGVGDGLTPARAGSTRTFPPPGCRHWTHPRSRGEHPHPMVWITHHGDSPPLARGAHRQAVAPHTGGGLTPARAGSTSQSRVPSRRAGTHPRSRGEHLVGEMRTGTTLDSPPLTRGAPEGSRLHFHSLGLTPARAGSTSPKSIKAPRSRTHPRSRGEHESADSGITGHGDSPPLARGAPLHRSRSLRLVGLTPARAGSTRSGRRSPRGCRTHPRSRGEHPRSITRRSSVQDSPPLARGARVQPCGAVRGSGLTPARAGSTLRDLLGYGYLAQAGHGRRGCGRPPRCFWCPLTNRVELRTPTQPGGRSA